MPMDTPAESECSGLSRPSENHSTKPARLSQEWSSQFSVVTAIRVGTTQMMTLLMNISLRMKPASVHLAQTKFATASSIVVQSTIEPLSALKVLTLEVAREALGVLSLGNVTHAVN
jgi:hypothetical protein